MRNPIRPHIGCSASGLAALVALLVATLAAPGGLMVPLTISVIAGILLAGGRILSGGNEPRRQPSPIPVRVRHDRAA